MPTTNGRLRRKILVEGFIKTVSGLHIGGSNMALSIGGIDAVVLRNPITREPYIPGSSVKGKMRSLTERAAGKWTTMRGASITNGPFMDDPRHVICLLYGLTPEAQGKDAAAPVSRLIVRDAPLTRSSAKKLENAPGADMPFTEVKTEVVIDRITSKAMPRSLERVPAGATFRLGLLVNVYEGDDEKALMAAVYQGLSLLQNDYLGGKGTRGSGEIRIGLRSVKGKDAAAYESNAPWKETTDFPIPQELQIRTRSSQST